MAELAGLIESILQNLRLFHKMLRRSSLRLRSHLLIGLLLDNFEVAHVILILQLTFSIVWQSTVSGLDKS
jgi:hypothetical protein